MERQRWWRGTSLVIAGLIAVCGCTVEEGGVPDPDAKPSASAGGVPSQAAPDDDQPAAQSGALPGVPGESEARSQLAALRVAPQGSMAGYSRSKFPHWSEQGENCNTRETVLERAGTDVQRDGECRAVSGTWVSVYDDITVTDASQLDIDHMVPLANGWRSGASRWSTEKRKAFANDLDHPQLLAVSATTNRSKGDQGPDEWQPPSKAYWCTYGRAWTSVKSTYDLSVTKAEKDMLTEMLDTCT
ncbi:HNH endonuclease family protein [Streptomyces sp. NPDC006879]|uniref:HNH endonuclease family protein n=1 Tax=Streptomyces sp. NPDC006879 TaxID=3364767 RepID=UPI0036C4F593